MNKEIEIPEGYEARIEGNKVIIELKESEDERIVNIIKGIIGGAKRGSTLKIGAKDADDCIAYLEKQKKQKPAEWSEEDESCWNLIWDILDGQFAASKEGYKKAAAWFLKNCPKGTKFFHSQPHWKPSEEQISALEYFIRSWGESGTMSPQNPTLCAAKSLYNDLKML